MSSATSIMLLERVISYRKVFLELFSTASIVHIKVVMTTYGVIHANDLIAKLAEVSKLNYLTANLQLAFFLKNLKRILNLDYA